MTSYLEELYGFGGEYAQTYKNKCVCGEIIEVSTQKDEDPEYKTDIYVRCQCGRSVHFELPVNQNSLNRDEK